MEMDNIQRLLTKYREGTLSEDELVELNRLTHKNEVLASAFHKADTLVRRRHMRIFSLALTGLVLLGVGVWMLVPGRVDSAPLMAEAVVDVPPAAVEVPQAEALAPTAVSEASASAKAVADEPLQVAAVFADDHPAPPQPAAIANTTPASVAKQKNVVVCNTQCEADSVISSIWKFLSA